MVSQKSGRRAPVAKTDISRLRSHQKKVTMDAHQAESVLNITLITNFGYVAFCRSRCTRDKILTVKGGNSRQCAAIRDGGGGNLSPLQVGSVKVDQVFVINY